MLAAVLKNDPDWTALPAETPANVRKVLRRCLERDRGRRFHDIADARIELEDSARDGTESLRRRPAAPIERPARQPGRGSRDRGVR